MVLDCPWLSQWGTARDRQLNHRASWVRVTRSPTETVWYTRNHSQTSGASQMVLEGLKLTITRWLSLTVYPVRQPAPYAQKSSRRGL